MIDKASFLHTVVSHGYTPAGIPPSLSLSAGGSKLEDPRLTALKTTSFPSCPKPGRANKAAEPPQVLLSQAWAWPRYPKIGRAGVALSPWSPCRGTKLIPELGWHFLWAKDENSCHSKSANRAPPQEFKGTFYNEYLICCFQAPDPLGFTSLTCASTWSFSLHADPAPRCHSRDSLQSYVPCPFLVGSCTDHIHKNMGVCCPKHVIHNKQSTTWIEGLKLKIKYLFWILFLV